MHCDVVIVGYRLNAREPAPKALERLLRLTPEAARTLARSFPAVVLRRAAEAEAEPLAEALRAAGAIVEVRPHGGDAPADRGAAGTAPRGTPATGAAFAPIPAPFPAPPATLGLPRAEASAPRPAPRPEPAPARAAPEQAAFQVMRNDAFTLETRAPEPTSAHFPEAREADEAPTSIYQLGDFGLDFGLPNAEKPAAPAAPAARNTPPEHGEDFSFDLDMPGGLSLELVQPDNGNAGRLAETPGQGAGFDDRFDGLEDASPRAPQVEEHAFRAIQRAPRAPDSRRPASASLAPRKAPSRVGPTLRAWLPSIALLIALSAGTVLAVGYALDPDDVFALVRARVPDAASQAADEAETRGDAHLHPLLRMTPAATRGPLAAILRARIAGVHQLPTTYHAADGRSIDCLLVEQRPNDTEARLDELRRTGREVAPPADATQALRDHAASIRAAHGKDALVLTSMCLAP